jgi:cellulose synthase/poly-beta-1,6-N-acetylglucosamine synthase-like glycosyltransferase
VDGGDHLARRSEDGSFATEEETYRGIASRLALSFAPRVALGAGAPADLAAIREARCGLQAEGDRMLYLAPEPHKVEAIAAWLAQHPELRDRIAIAAPRTLRAALIESAGHEIAEDVVLALATRQPQFSARRVLSRAQVVFGLLALPVLAALLWFEPRLTLMMLVLLTSSLFFGVAVLRLIASHRLARFGRPPHPDIPGVPDEDLPVYTLLVPLYKEERVTGDLVHALQSIHWPIDRLDVKLILEADDADTRRAVEHAIGGTPFEIIVAPPVEPRTKPKALAFALQFARGELVTVYDAEDRPHPMQLREAHAAFSRSGPDLACVQAPLLVDNAQAGILARYFALEYAALFDGLLPALAALRMPLPLGGTSNHFRRTALEQVGGWDPFNVTEDADLGMRLARFGYRCDTISRPTWEEAPVAAGVWMKQRTRWFKGWLQTFFVHTRTPVVLARQLGLRNTIGFVLVGLGMLVSAIIHPIYVFNAIRTALDPLSLWDGGILSAVLAGISLFNLVAGYYAAIQLSWRAMRVRDRRRHLLALATLPVYWLLMSIACINAVRELVMHPHQWNKTPHRGREKRPASGRAGTAAPKPRTAAPAE